MWTDDNIAENFGLSPRVIRFFFALHRAIATAMRNGNFGVAEMLPWPVVVSRDGKRAVHWPRPGPPLTHDHVETMPLHADQVEEFPWPEDPSVDDVELPGAPIVVVFGQLGLVYRGPDALVYLGNTVKGSGAEPEGAILYPTGGSH